MTSSSGYQHINGLRLFVHRTRDESRAPSGLTIVLIHGFMDSGGTWDMVAPVLARAGHDVVAPDLRGFGLSDSIGAGGYYHFPDYVADLAALVDALAPRRLSIVGHSMGGTVAALYAGAHPDRVERLALLEGTGPMSTEPSVAVDRMQAWLRTMREVPRVPKTLSSLQEAIERLSLHHPRVPRDVIESRAKLLTRADDAGRLLWAYDPMHRTTAPTPFNAPAFEEFLRRIDCPTLVVGGGPTGWHPPDEAQRIACLRHAVRVELPTAGHMMHWTEPAALAHHLGQFFGEPPKTRAQAPNAGAPASSAHAAAVPASAHSTGAPQPASAHFTGAPQPASAHASGVVHGGGTHAGGAHSTSSPQAVTMGGDPAYPPARPAEQPSSSAKVTAPGAPAPSLWGGGDAQRPPVSGAAPVGPTAPPTGLPQAHPASAPGVTVPPGVPGATAPGAPGAPGASAPPGVTAPPSPSATPGVTAPGRPIYGGAAADISAAPTPAPGPMAGSVPIVPTRPSGGTPQGGGTG